ncbi:MAG TPA: CvpA family protein, partial [Pseudomonadales bacterium]|nr:CvpA family protein [Pseudomonadales bacterium]
MSALVWIDWTILGVITLSALLSLTRGFMREAVSLLSLLVAVVVARLFSGQMELLLAGWIASAPLRTVAAFALLFFGVLVMGGILGRLLGHLLRVSGLGMFDRLL